ncbi:MAG TPA: cation-transporting P-type ATPase, partial [Clostridia bacterium]|nr:cation-transporting P-type ATPase [Clostridia bacterium]
MTDQDHKGLPEAAKQLSGEEACLKSIEEVEGLLASSRQEGLSSQEARSRLELYGPNLLEGEKSTPFIVK